MTSKIEQTLFLFFLIILAMSFLNNHNGVEGRFVSISVESPYEIRSNHDAAIFNFGVPDYGGSMVGSVVYPGKGKYSKGCKPFEGDQPFKSKSTLPTILLLDRGDCYLALKVWNGQHAGAAAVLVADDIEEPLISMDIPRGSSDGSGGYIEKINIPSALVKKSFGQILKDCLDKGEDLVVKIDWSRAGPDIFGAQGKQRKRGS